VAALSFTFIPNNINIIIHAIIKDINSPHHTEL